MPANRAPAWALLCACTAAGALPAAAQQRAMTPADLFRVEQVGSVAWAPDGRHATVEIRRPGRWLDGSLPTFEMRVLDSRSAVLRTLRAPGGPYLGFFGASWSPGGRRVLFLSLDTAGVVRPWVWEAGATSARLVPGVEVRYGGGDRNVAVWTGDERVLVLAREEGARNEGSLYFRVTRGRNAADAWARAARGEATPTVLESGGPPAAAPAARLRIVAVDFRSGAHRTLARGDIHLLRLSPDRRTLAFFRQRPGAPVASHFARDTEEDRLYDRLNWGTELNLVDAATGAPRGAAVEIGDPHHETLIWLPGGVPALRAGDDLGAPPRWVALREGRLEPAVLAPVDTASARPASPPPGPPREGALRVGTAPARDAALYVAEDPADGTRLWLARTGAPPVELWRGNEWVRSVRTGRAEAVAYTALDGGALTGWILYPPGYVPGTRVPVVTVVYPGHRFTARTPATFSPLSESFEHPQMLAALGYAVVRPSMPEVDRPFAADAVGAARNGVLPLLDTLVARGIADPERIAVLGQSAGGFAALALVTTTDRFRTAIASASYSNLVSLYGTLYGQHRYGDAGDPRHGQLLRMLQVERGSFGTGAPPWEAPERFHANSPLLRAAHVRAPVMLVHGDLDFIPVQQAEEFFTALYRQDKRARLVRYHGEWHTISARANVLDLWVQIESWLRETMPPR
jgi:dienelactone hydrolase